MQQNPTCNLEGETKERKGNRRGECRHSPREVLVAYIGGTGGVGWVESEIESVVSLHST